MLISKKWLEDFLVLPKKIKSEDIGHDLTMKTVEVEKINNLAHSLQKVVVGVITKVEKHSNADTLKVCQVDAGKNYGQLQIVCGGMNLKENMKVALALVGAKVHWHGQDELFELAKVKLRGEESNGMICASDELGLEEMFPKQDEKEIMDLSYLDAKEGVLLSSALGLDDTIFDIDNKSITNRPDLWSHYGLVRELAAIYQLGLKPFQLDDKLEIKKSKGKANGELKVSIKDYSLCPRYLGAVVSGIKVKESPLWLKNILTSVGLRPINNIVDITNYVMIEVGQPLHAFDRSKVDNIVVRLANQGEKIITLDKIERELSPEMLVIADSKKPIAVAGVMGGANSQVDETTKAIIIEAAKFDAISIRKTTQRLGLRTDASMRFEKSLDPNLAETAIRRVCALIKEIIPGAEIDGIIVADGNLLNKKNTSS